jgi:hypothetical protein
MKASYEENEKIKSNIELLKKQYQLGLKENDAYVLNCLFSSV